MHFLKLQVKNLVYCLFNLLPNPASPLSDKVFLGNETPFFLLEAGAQYLEGCIFMYYTYRHAWGAAALCAHLFNAIVPRSKSMGSGEGGGGCPTTIGHTCLIFALTQLLSQSRQSSKLFLKPTELGLPQPLTRRRARGGVQPLAREGGGGQTLWFSLYISTLCLKALTDHLGGGSRVDSFDPQW